MNAERIFSLTFQAIPVHLSGFFGADLSAASGEMGQEEGIPDIEPGPAMTSEGKPNE